MNKKLLLAGAIGTGVLGVAALVPIAVYAQSTDANSAVSTFVQKLASKLGVDQSKLQSALDQTQTEIKTERDAEFKTQLKSAVTNGKITQKQADILTAMLDIRPTKLTTTDKPTDLSSLTEEQRKAKMDEMKTRMDKDMVDALAKKGLTVTVDEIDAAHKAARDAGLDGPGFHTGFGHGVPGLGKADMMFEMKP